MESTPAPHFLGRNAVCEPAEALRAKVSLVLPSRPDWNSVAADFLHDFFPGHVWIVEKFFTESDRHFEVYSIGIQAIGRLLNNSFLHNAAGEVKGSKSRVDFLLHKVIPFAVKVHKPRAVL